MSAAAHLPSPAHAGVWFGASALALARLGRRHGYTLVYAHSRVPLLFFVRAALLEGAFARLLGRERERESVCGLFRRGTEGRDAGRGGAAGDEGEERGEGGEGEGGLVEHVSSVVAGVDFRGCADGDYAHSREWVASAQAFAEARRRLAAA